MPFTYAAGRIINAETETFLEMESQLDDLPAAQTSYIYAADNATLLTMFYEEYRQETSLVHISPYLVDAIIAAEDARFYEHNGVDIKGWPAPSWPTSRPAGLPGRARR